MKETSSDNRLGGSGRGKSQWYFGVNGTKETKDRYREAVRMKVEKCNWRNEKPNNDPLAWADTGKIARNKTQGEGSHGEEKLAKISEGKARTGKRDVWKDATRMKNEEGKQIGGGTQRR
ncbi:uncharacterized protein SPSK_06743 [Sporothrix schenckii 1099-18]|uniref:Uncharacterized protein n=1 Tax=Sporothrix schenckii 1099-18 TaxID=1397361 RepID=A0A0F2MJP3_SPOSC|nr:uncharacterized protein SPSK_06743 [Sporothrix schenckii 1099-18]KJR89842.1 hypothetical protein SPSK_06743 [Sporothrix schenckii 1099-18]